MRYLMAGIFLFLWMIFTLALCVSMIGILILIDPDERWMSIGTTLVNTFKT